MRKKTIFLVYPLLIMGVFLVFVSSCKKDKDDNPTPKPLSNGSGAFTCGDPFTDTRDGNVYPTIQIGNQCWMAKNLAYLPSVVGSATGSDTIPYYYVYSYNGTDVSAAKATANYTTYGVLYNWPAAMAESTSSTANPSGVQGACPAGWHLPSESEFGTLLSNFGSNAYHALKDGGSSGFNALFGGWRSHGGYVHNIGSYGRWWSSSLNDTSNAWYLIMSSISQNAVMYYYGKEYGFSVRCLRD